MPPPVACSKREKKSQGMNCGRGELLSRIRIWRSAYNTSVGLRANARILRTKCINNSSQAKVDPSGHESRRDCQAHNLHQETCLTPLVLMTLDPPNIANDFEDDSGKHGEVKSECSAGESIGCEKSDKGDGKECEESGIGRERNSIVIVG